MEPYVPWSSLLIPLTDQVQTSRTTWHDRAPSAGVRTVLLVFLTRTASKISPLLFGTERSMWTISVATLDHTNSDSDFLKERLFGLSNPQGNHGESLKEAHFHLDNTPTVCHLSAIGCTANNHSTLT